MKPPPPKEITTHMQVATVLRSYARTDWLWSHIPNGEDRNPIVGAKLARMGTKAGWPDFLLIAPGGRAHALELKRAGGRLNEAQAAFRDHCLVHGTPHAVAFDLDGALEALTNWGALRMRILAGGVPDLAEAGA